jgi:hypothetical protein
LSEKFNYFILLISKSQKAVRSYNIPPQLPFGGELTMQIFKLYTMVLNKIQVFTKIFLNNEKPKAGRKPKLTDEKIASIFILSFITGMPVMKIANQTLNPSIKSYHICNRL